MTWPIVGCISFLLLDVMPVTSISDPRSCICMFHAVSIAGGGESQGGLWQFCQLFRLRELLAWDGDLVMSSYEAP